MNCWHNGTTELKDHFDDFDGEDYGKYNTLSLQNHA